MERRRTSRRVSVAEQTADRLRSALTDRRWSVGDKLPSEVALAEEFGVGRSTAREAIQRLARDGLVEVRHGTGIFVVDGPAQAAGGQSIGDLLRRARILEVYEVRRGLEVEAARLAAVRADPAALAVLSGLLDERQLLVGADVDTFVDADLRFHRAVIEAAGNDLLAALFEQFYEPLRAAIATLVRNEPDLPDTSRDHAELLDALRAADPDRAARATVEHFDVVIRLLRGTARGCTGTVASDGAGPR